MLISGHYEYFSEEIVIVINIFIVYYFNIKHADLFYIHVQCN